MESKAEEFKKKGNEEFQKQNYDQAVQFYTKALGLQENEAIYTNRAISFIHLR